MISLEQVMSGMTAEDIQTSEEYEQFQDCLSFLKSKEEQLDDISKKITVSNYVMGAVVASSVALAAWSVKKTFF